MIDNAQESLFELCKKVYELTEWDNDGGLDSICKEGGVYTKDAAWLYSLNYVPLYTTDYLLEKLSGLVDYVSMSQNNKVSIDSGEGEKGEWYAHYWLKSRRLQVSSNTPLKALLKLIIALSEAGELK